MTKQIINSDKAPKAIGPYSQAVISQGKIYLSGQLPIDPSTGKMVEGLEAQTKQSLHNIKAILESANLTLDHVVKVGIFLKDLANFKIVNEIYGTYFTQNYPARSTVQVAKLPMDAEVEIEVIAAL